MSEGFVVDHLQESLDPISDALLALSLPQALSISVRLAQRASLKSAAQELPSARLASRGGPASARPTPSSSPSQLRTAGPDHRHEPWRYRCASIGAVEAASRPRRREATARNDLVLANGGPCRRQRSPRLLSGVEHAVRSS